MNIGKKMHGEEKGKNRWAFNFASKAVVRKQAVIDQMLKWGEGCRASVYVQWNADESHVFSAEVINGKVVFVDSQSGESNVERYFSKQKHPRFGIRRVDKLKIDGYSKLAVKKKQ